MIPFIFSIGYAAPAIISFEEMEQISGPETVYVIGKTGNPSPVFMQDTLMESTKWQWLIKTKDGYYRPSGQYVNMTAYQAMSIGERSMVFNHQECRLQVEIKSDGSRHISSFSVYSGPVTVKGVVLPVLGLVVIFFVSFICIQWDFNRPAVERVEAKRPGKLLPSLFFLSMLFDNNKKKK